ncbi:hypothetical protein ACA910_000835 [Epithemia clementina (nom. ined.)]
MGDHDSDQDEYVEEVDEDINVRGQSASTPQAPTLSKSWSVNRSHVPTFSGGKISIGYATSSPTTETVASDEDNQNEGQKSDIALDNFSEQPFLILPVGGDLAIVAADRGTMLCSIRGQASADRAVVLSSSNDDDDAENDEVDMDAITSYALSSNSKILLTCSHNNIIRQYSMDKITIDGDTAANMPALPPPSSTTRPKSVVSLTKSWGKSAHTLPVNFMEFHRSNVFVATGSVDGAAGVYDVRGGFVTHLFRPYQSVDGGGSGRLSVTALEWMPDIHRLVIAIGRDDGSIAIHNLRDEEGEEGKKSKKNHHAQVILLHDHVSAVTSMRWPRLPRNQTYSAAKLFVTAGRDSVINVWKIEESTGKKKKKSLEKQKTYKRVQTIPVFESITGMEIIAFTSQDPKEVLVATAGGKGRVKLWTTPLDSPNLKLLDEQPLEESFGEKRGGYSNLIYSHPRKREADKYATITGQLIVADAEHNISFLAMQATSEHDRRLSTVRTIVGHNDEILDLKIIPPPSNKDPSAATGSNRIVVATNSAQVRIFDLSTFSCQVLDRHTATVLCVDVSPCGRYIATCGKDRTMRLWNVATLKCVAVAAGHTEAVGSTALSRQIARYSVKGKAATNGGGSFVVTVSVDRTLKRWNLPGAEVLDAMPATEPSNGELTLKAFATARAHEKDINVVSIAPNDSLIATGSQDKTVKIWKATDLTLQASLIGHRRGVWDCQFSPHDRVLATASGDQTVKLWSLSDYTCVRTFQGHIGSVLRVRFLCFGMQLVSSGADGLLKVWTIRTNECETTMDGHGAKAWALDLTADGKSMVSGGADSRIVVWTDTTKEEEEAKNVKKEEGLMLDQKLANHLRYKEYEQALDITLDLDKPYQALRVFSAIIETDVAVGRIGIEPLARLAASWSNEKLVRVLQYCREWNTRSRNCHVALLLIRAILSTIPIHVLASIEGVPQIMAGIVPYAERHFDRLDRLHESSFLIEYVLGSMGGTISTNASDFSEDLAKWEIESKMVLPSTSADGRIQVGGNAIVGLSLSGHAESQEVEEDVVTVGESSDEDD